MGVCLFIYEPVDFSSIIFFDFSCWHQTSVTYHVFIYLVSCPVYILIKIKILKVRVSTEGFV